jgi:hypothetical protein
MLELHVGFSKKIEVPKKGGCLFIADEVPKLPSWRRAKVFDPLKHSFNLMDGMDYRKASAIEEVFDAAFPRGDGTLTKDTGLDFIGEALDGNPASFEGLVREPDKKSSTGHVWAYGKVRRILRSPVLRQVLCNRTNFPFKRGSVILARLNRAELGEFDALVLGLFLMAHFKGQIVVPDFGFYGREAQVSLIREGRLIAGVNTLNELSPKLRQAVLLIKDKVGSGATIDDAEVLAMYAGHVRATTGFNDFVQEAME